MNNYRSHNCGELTLDNVDHTVDVAGWINKKRDHGGLLFVDLRDHFGITQCVINADNKMFEKLETIKLESVIKVIGKGSKERLIPMGEEAMNWVEKYISYGRPELENESFNTSILFLNRRGKPMSRQAFWYRIKHYAFESGIKASLSPHTIRHAFATHLINHGADLRTVQLLLGHTSLSTTQIYTEVARQRMKELHSEHHPRG